MRILRAVLVGAGIAAAMAPASGQAQSASADWNGNYTFRGSSERFVDLAQAALIRRGENGDFRVRQDRNGFLVFDGTTFFRLGFRNDDFYGSRNGFLPVDRSGDFWADWSAEGISIAPR